MTATSRDARVRGEHVLDLERVDVLAARDDHVVDATDDPEVAVVVEPARVARVVPAVADRLRVGVRTVPVAGERLVGGEVAEISPVRRTGGRRAFTAGRPAQPGLRAWSRPIENV